MCVYIFSDNVPVFLPLIPKGFHSLYTIYLKGNEYTFMGGQLFQNSIVSLLKRGLL